MDESQYLEIFIDETKEHLEEFNNKLLLLEKEPENKEAIWRIFGMAHSLKGMAYVMTYKRMQRLTRDIESISREVAEDRMKMNPELLDILFQCLIALKEHLSCVIETSDEGTNENEPLIARLDAILLKQGISNESR
jgi:two-component system chemotaxis sensor kinase CheA